MKAKIFTLFLFLAVFGVAQAQLIVLTTPAAPVIDGIIDESDPWGGIEEWTDQLEMLGSTSASSSKFKILHDDDNIYVAVEVMDETPANAHTTDHQNDCVEIFFHMSNDISETAYGPSTSQTRYQRVEDAFEFTMGGSNTIPIETFTDHAGFDYKSESDAEGYVLEVSLPIEVLDDGILFDDVDFYFEIATADNTGDGRTQQIFWNDNSDQQWQDVSTFGAAQLSDDEISIGAVEAVKQELGSVFVKNDMLNFRNVEGAVNIYSISGALIIKDVIERNGSLDISALKSGIYVVKADKFSAKIVK